MKNPLIIVLFAMLLMSCKSKIADTENLPKDVAFKKELNKNFPSDSTNLENMQREIVDLIATKTCENANNWKISAIGAKPCGGPAYFIAYPKEMENTILPKIKTYSLQEAGFNEKYGLNSDCTIEKEPSGITCENGKAVLKY